MNQLQEILDSISILLSPPVLFLVGVILLISGLVRKIRLLLFDVEIGETPREKRNALILGTALILIALGMINGIIPQLLPNPLLSDDPQDLWVRALGYEVQGEKNLARQAYEKALRNSRASRSQDPQTRNTQIWYSSQIWYSYGVFLSSKLGEYKNAIDAYTNAIAATVNQAYPEAWREKGVSHLALGEYKAALDCYDKVIQLPNTSNSLKSIAWNDKGWVYENSFRNYQDAANSYSQANILDLNNTYAFSNLNRLNQQGLTNQLARLPTYPININVTAPPSSLQPIPGLQAIPVPDPQHNKQ